MVSKLSPTNQYLMYEVFSSLTMDAFHIYLCEMIFLSFVDSNFLQDSVTEIWLQENDYLGIDKLSSYV